MVDAPKGIDRRDFLKLGAVASGVAIGCGAEGPESEAPAAPGRMGSRPLGGTGLEVSELAFGAHGGFRYSAGELGSGTAVATGRFVAGVHCGLPGIPVDAQQRLLAALVDGLGAGG